MFPSWPSYSIEEIEATKNVLTSGKVNYWTGSEGKTFEKEFSAFCGTKYSIAMSNGSLALSAAYLAIGLKPNDEVITTPRTFIATSSSLCLLKAKPIFADVDINSGCITAKSIEPLISKKTKAIAVVHIAGWPCDMKEICDLAKHYGIYVIEDCAQAHGAQIEGQSVGSFGDISVWSFCQDKIISTGGEGGLVSTNNFALWDKMWSFKDHGKTQSAIKKKSNHAGFRYVHDRFGSNFRMTEIQSCIGRIQLRNLNEINKLRTRNAMILRQEIIDLEFIRAPLPSEKYTHAWYKFHCYLKHEKFRLGWDRNRIISEIKENGYPAFHGSCSEIYLEQCFKEIGFAPNERLKTAKLLGERSLMFLVHHKIPLEVMYNYSKLIRKILKKAFN